MAPDGRGLEPGGDWSAYARLVLTELERLNTGLSDIRREINAQTLSINNLGRDYQSLTLRVDKLDDAQNPRSLIARVAELEDVGIGTSAVKKWRWGIIVFLVGLISSIVLPLVALILTQRGGN